MATITLGCSAGITRSYRSFFWFSQSALRRATPFRVSGTANNRCCHGHPPRTDTDSVKWRCSAIAVNVGISMCAWLSPIRRMCGLPPCTIVHFETGCL